MTVYAVRGSRGSRVRSVKPGIRWDEQRGTERVIFNTVSPRHYSNIIWICRMTRLHCTRFSFHTCRHIMNVPLVKTLPAAKLLCYCGHPFGAKCVNVCLVYMYTQVCIFAYSTIHSIQFCFMLCSIPKFLL